MAISRVLRAAINVVRNEGVGVFFRRLHMKWQKINKIGWKFQVMSMLKKIDVIGFYDFVRANDKGTLQSIPDAKKKNTINWLIPDFGIGSGGHLNIFRYIQKLEESGYVNTICLVGSHRHSSPEQAKELINKHFFKLQADVVFGVENLDFAYFSFATGWTTAYALKAFGNTAHKLYFVQDFEPAFYAHGSEYDFAEKTYTFGFTGVCAGVWLSELLEAKYGMKSYSVGFSYDRDLYERTARREPEIKRVFCYCRPPTLRRGLETALLTLDLVGQRLPNVKFIFAGWDMSDYYFPHEHLNAGMLSLKELPDLYSQCDVALVISYTNLSLLPLEIMACGCAVVSNTGPNVEWLLNDSISMLSDSSPQILADSIINVLEDDALRSKLTDNALNFIESTSWDAEAKKLDEILKSMA